MVSSFFLPTVVAAISLFTLLRKVRFHQDIQDNDSSSPSSSLSPSSVPPPSSSRILTHHVFPSFHSEDVRRDFLSHIQMEFERKSITMFIDNEIKRGESIGPELIRAIKESKIAIVLLSRNYASSEWCLDELVEIIKCREEFDQTVLTIFYKVDPCDVGKLTGDFGKVFRKTCVGKNDDDIGRWRQALSVVATIAGYQSNKWDKEAAMIQKIATDVLNELNNSIKSSDFDGLVGMRTHLVKMEPLLCLESDEVVRMIGIWGPPGIGKTTIARVLYNKLSKHFQLHTFVDKIEAKEKNPCSDDYGTMLQFQKWFLSKIFNHKDMEVSHLGVVQNMLKDKKVLVVLDGVEKSIQLDAMAKETSWFGPGSIIIITSQDHKLLRVHGIKHIYKVDLPEYEVACKIFCKYAFGHEYPKDGFETLIDEVTELAGELPLGLKVLGSHFKGMCKEGWKKTMPRLETSLDTNIHSILKFSYDALDDEDKCLFLHIACIFNGAKIKIVEGCLSTKFSEVRQRLYVLAEKSLISLDNEIIYMEILLEKLGKEIVRKPSIQDHVQRQFLIEKEEIHKVLSVDAAVKQSLNVFAEKSCILLKEDKGFVHTEILLKRLSRETFRKQSIYEHEQDQCLIDGKELYEFCPKELEEVDDHEEEFDTSEREPRFQFCHSSRRKRKGYHVIANTLTYPRGLKVRSHKFRSRELGIVTQPSKCLPTNVRFELLHEIALQCSELEKLWEGIKPLPNLKFMDMSGSRNLWELPDLSNATNLLELNLSGCISLVEIPSSIGYAISLEKLKLSNCSELSKLPSCLENATNLMELDLGGCQKLLELPSFIWNVTTLKKLDLSRLPNLVELPSSVGNLTSLERLYLHYCSNLRELPPSIENLHKLEILRLGGCFNLRSIPATINLKSLSGYSHEYFMRLKSPETLDFSSSEEHQS